MIDAARPGSLRRIWAAVPFKGPVGSKRRLAELLDPSERERLSLAMLADVLDVLLGSEWIERVLLLTRSGDDVHAPRHERLTIVQEPRGTYGGSEDGRLNGALRHAQQIAEASGADSLLIMPADLPLVASADLDALLDISSGVAMAIVPDRAAEGTNALLLTPPTALEPSFGTASFARHLQLAHEAGLSIGLLKRDGIELDLDTPADVAELLARGHDGRAATLLRELRVDLRLAPVESAQARSTTI